MAPKSPCPLSSYVLTDIDYNMPVVKEILGQFQMSTWSAIETLLKTADPKASKARRRAKLHRMMRELKMWGVHLDTHWDLNDEQADDESEFRMHCPTWNRILSVSRDA
jgi:hypothetical protein